MQQAHQTHIDRLVSEARSVRQLLINNRATEGNGFSMQKLKENIELANRLSALHEEIGWYMCNVE